MNYYLERIQEGIDYIESRLDEEIPLADVARAAGVSQWHFQRIFKALTGETLKTYIRSRRFANSLDRLLTTKLRILDIALLAGFDSQESFARAFKMSFGLTPQEYRRLGKKTLFLRKAQIDAEYLKHINENVSLAPEIAVQPGRTLVGLRTQLFSVDSEKNNIAQRLPPLWGAFLSRLSEIEGRVPGACYGVIEQERRDSERRREEAKREKERERRERDIAAAEAALEQARRDHEARLEDIEKDRAALDKRSQAEDARWRKKKEELEAELRRARSGSHLRLV